MCEKENRLKTLLKNLIMINNFSFENYRMFNGKYNIQLKPLTIFTGTNNSGKTSMLKFIHATLQNFRGCAWIDETKLSDLWKNSRSSDKEQLINGVRLNQITINRVFKSDLELDFHFGIPPIIHLEKKVTFRGDENQNLYYWLRISINIENLKQFIKINTEENSTYYRSIEGSKINGKDKYQLSDLLLFIDSPINQDSIDKIMDNNGSHSSVRLSIQKNKITIDSYFPLDYYPDTDTNIYLNFCCDTLINKLSPHTQNKIIASFQRVIEFSMMQLIIFPLRRLQSQAQNSWFFSAFRGYFSEQNSEARKSFLEFLEYKNQYNWPNNESAEAWNLLFDKWLKEFGIGLSWEKPNQFEMIPIINTDFGQRKLTEYGFGVQQIFPLLMALHTNPTGTFFIEEPESHLHPSFQSKLADFFVDNLNASKKRYGIGHQIFIETHSEYFLRKLQYLVAKGEISAEKIAIHYIGDVNEAGERDVYEIRVDSDGSLDRNFGPGFFDEATNWKFELMRIKHAQKN